MIEHIKAFFVDVDGTLTNGLYHVSSSGNISKSFYTRDIYAINRVQELGIYVHVVTQSSEKCSVHQCDRVNIPISTGIHNKLLRVNEILEKFGMNWSHAAFIGDAENDIECMNKCAFSACPSDSIPEILDIANYVSGAKGGYGAVYDILRHFVELKNEPWIDKQI